jgi:phage-related holin
MLDRILKIDMSFTGLLKSAPYFGASMLYWLADYGVNVKFLGVFLLLWTFDIITGIVKSIVVPTMRRPDSKTGLRRVASKFVMLIFPVILATIYSLFTDDAVKMLNWGLMILSLHEGYSTLGNLYSIRTGQELTEFDAVSYSIKLMADWIRKKVDRLLYVIEGGTRNDDWKDNNRRGDQYRGGYDESDFSENGDYNLPKDEENEIMPED